MLNNDIFRQLRYALNLPDSSVIDLCKLAGLELTVAELRPYLLKEDEEGFLECPDDVLIAFLDGLIIHKRGPKKDGAPTPPPEKLSNNLILKKIRIALQYQETDMLEIFELGERKISKHELTALFRKPGHRQYRECKFQFMKSFLRGLTNKLRG